MFEPLSGIPGDSENFFAGRSILFAIPEKLVTTISTELKIHMKVEKNMPDEVRLETLLEIFWSLPLGVTFPNLCILVRRKIESFITFPINLRNSNPELSFIHYSGN